MSSTQLPSPEMPHASFLWRYLGAMMTERKNGGMAASFTRVLGIFTFILWVTVVVVYLVHAFSDAATVMDPTVLYVVSGVLSSFVLSKSAKDFGKALKGHSSYTAPGEPGE